MRDVISIDPHVAGDTPSLLDLAEARRSIDRGIQDLGGFISQAQDVTRACLNSGVLFAPARFVPDNTSGAINWNRRAIVAVGHEAAALLEPIYALQPVMRTIDNNSGEPSPARERMGSRAPGPILA